MIRRLGNLLVLALAAYLLVWAYEGLFRADQSGSVLPFLDGPDGGYVAVIMVGVAFGFLTLSPAGDFVGPGRSGDASGWDRTVAVGRRGRSGGPGSAGGASLSGGGVRPGSRRAARMAGFAIGIVKEYEHTGLTINDVPQYDIYLTVQPATGEPFVGRARTMVRPGELGGMAPGMPLGVRYDPAAHDRLGLADPDDPDVIEAVLEWRVQRGLIDPALVGARLHGVVAPASVLEVRPTGRRQDGQVELDVTLLVLPEDDGTAATAIPEPSADEFLDMLTRHAQEAGDASDQGREVRTRVFVYPEALSRVQVGSPVFALYEPHAPELVAMTIGDPRQKPSGAIS